MSNHASSGLGTTLTFNGNIVSDVTKIGAVELTADAQEVSNQSSTAKEYISGMPDGGEISIEGFLYPGDTNGQIAMKNAVGGAAVACSINFPAAFAASWSFNALVTAFSTGDVELEGGLPFTATLKITGLPVLSVTNSTGLTTPFVAISESAVVTPAPSGSVYTYVATVLTEVTSVTVTPTASAGVITVNGNVVASGVASSAITLGAAGSVTPITIVVTETGKMPKSYVIYLSRALA